MDFLLRYFSLILIAGVLVNAVVAHRRIPAFVAARGGGTEEPLRFVWGGAALFSALFIAPLLLSRQRPATLTCSSASVARVARTDAMP